MERYYKVPETVREDIKNLKDQVESFKQGKISSAKFRGFRVPLGIYEQRVENTYMMRVRIPGGGISPFQLRELSRLAQEYQVKLHLTTRQDIQLQSVSLDQLVSLYRELYKIGLTCKGGGGNTVRNITACPDAGICSDEIFNVLSFSIALTEYLIQFPSSYNLPRKFKIAFSGCSKDCALATVNDLGFIAKSQDGELGFSVYTGGGMGAHSRVAEKIYDFVPIQEIGYVAEAVKRLFDKHGDRQNKHRARLRFVLEKQGLEKFKELFFEELKRVKEEGPIDLNLPELKEGRENEVRIPPEKPLGNGYEEWQKTQVFPQKQKDFYAVKIPVPLGDIEPENLKKIATLSEEAGDGSLRTTQTQDLLFRFLGRKELAYVYNRLKELGLTQINQNINYLICCKGAATCKLGICLSQGLAQALASTLDKSKVYLSETPEINIRINGCPNACGGHPIGSLGLYGAARRVRGRIGPYYNICLGGFVEEGKTRLGEAFGYVPAKNVPLLIKDFLKSYNQSYKKTSPSFFEFSKKEGKAILKELIKKYETPPTYEENPDYYRDFGVQEEFSLAGRGPGECGAGVLDMIKADLEEATAAYESYQVASDVKALYQAVLSLSKSLLVTKGLDPKDDLEAFRSFKELFIESGWVSPKYLRLIEAAQDYQLRGQPKSLRDNQAFLPDLIARIRVLYESMDSNLQFQIAPEEEVGKEKEAVPAKKLDLRGVPCPINYVRAKVVLEELELGDLLELLLDEGEPIENVPPSLENDGQEILEVRKENGHYYLKVKKRSNK